MSRDARLVTAIPCPVAGMSVRFSAASRALTDVVVPVVELECGRVGRNRRGMPGLWAVSASLRPGRRFRLFRRYANPLPTSKIPQSVTWPDDSTPRPLEPDCQKVGPQCGD